MQKSINLSWPLLCLFLLALRASAQANNDFLLLPGERAGPIRATTTERELRTAFGSAQVVDKAVPGPEGEPVDATIVFPRTFDRITIFYTNALHTHVESVRVETVGGRWHTREGVHVNMPLAALIRLNLGRTIHFYGFDWDYGGSVTDWGGGPLAAAFGHGGLATLQLGHEAARYTAMTERQKSQVTGEKTIASDHPALRVLQPFVQTMNLKLDEVSRSHRTAQ